MKEECAVFGIYSNNNVFDKIYYGLYSMQHRGQESAGIATFTDKIELHKGMGLVSEVFSDRYLEGNLGIGHVRYSTTGCSEIENAQPFVIDYAKGSLAIAHNGNLVNSDYLRSLLKKQGNIFTTTSDTELIAHLITQEHLKTDNIVDAVRNSMNRLEGSYALVILQGKKLIAVRDPYGFKPLVLGRSENSYVVASESCALDAISATLIRDVKAGEIVVIDNSLTSYNGRRSRISHCMFEYVYFARPDSIINGVSIYEVRKDLGAVLSREAPVDADVVTAVPASGITAAIGYSQASKIPYGEGLIKNRYFGRTFIIPEQRDREKGVLIKLNPIKSEIKDKKLVLIDDSIVRGTTIRKIIKLLYNSGASEVHVRITCPPIRHPCYYGIDMQTHKEFIAQEKSVEEIREEIGADSLAYMSLDGLVEAIGIPKNMLCLACLNGCYPIIERQMKLTK